MTTKLYLNENGNISVKIRLPKTGITRSGRLVEIEFDGCDTKVSVAQNTKAEWLWNNLTKVSVSIIQRGRRHGRYLRKMWVNQLDAEDMADAIIDGMAITAIKVHKGSIWDYSIFMKCDMDPEHGLGMVLKKDKVIKCDDQMGIL